MNANQTDYNATFNEINKLMLECNFVEARSILQSMDENQIPVSDRFFYYKALSDTILKTHTDDNQFYEALKYLEKSVDYLEDDYQKSSIYGTIAVYLIQKNKIDDAQKYLDQCFNFASSEVSKTFAYKIKGRILSLRNSLEESLDSFTEASFYAEKTHNELMLFYITLEIATVFEKLNFLRIAFSECNKAERYARSLRDGVSFYRCIVYKAQLLYKLGMEKEVKELIIGTNKIFD